MPTTFTPAPRVHCYQCGYDWSVRRTAPPARCPRCQSRSWWDNRKQLTLAIANPPGPAPMPDENEVHHEP